VQVLRVDWPVYPRRAKHNTVAEGGNRRWAETARQNPFQSAGPMFVRRRLRFERLPALRVQRLAENGREGVGWAAPYPEGDKGPPLAVGSAQRGRRRGGASCANPTTASSAPSETG
jgi:hypothetical protein